jgi:type I restriction enzyme S subunit
VNKFAVEVSMKSTENPWLGDIPARWQSMSLKRVATTGAGSGFPPADQGNYDEEIPFLKVNSLSRGDSDGVLRWWDYTVSEETAARLNARVFRAGSLVIAKIGAALLLSRVRILDRPSCIDNNMMAIQAREGTDPRFLYFAVSTIKFDWLVNPGAVPSTSEGAVGRFELAFPSIDEQRQIAKYLDRETGQIDELITKQEQLVATLTERRQAVITQAVTRGLDPATELKASGVDWWDDIPNHWSLPQVKHHFRVTLGKMLDAKRPAQRGDTLLPYVRAGNIHEESLSLDELNEMPFSPTEVNSLSLIRGDLLVVEGGAVGVNQYLHGGLPGISFQKTVNRVRAVGPVSTRFLGYVLDVLRYRGIIDMLCNKSTIAHFTAEKLEQISFPCPPALEQQAIVLFLNSECAAIETLSSKAIDVIALLRERRQALISAAVTGKIDVRGL